MRVRLIETVIRQFGETGFEGASTHTIAVAAHTTMSKITYHFGSKHGLLCFAGVAMACLPGCISLAPYSKQPGLVADIPTTFGDPAVVGEYRPEAWWNAFEDDQLNALVSDALAQNLDIAEAAARVERARAQARIARSAMVPAINATISAIDASTPIAGSAFGGLGGAGFDRIETETYAPSIGAAYELDLFGRVRNDFAASRKDAIASEFALQSVQLAAAAETISAYFDIVDTRRQIELTQLTIDVLVDRTARTEERFERGLIDSFELYQVRQELRVNQAALPQLESALATSIGRLAVLTSRFPEDIGNRLDTVLQPRLVLEPVPAGLPSELLLQRPDVSAEWTRLEAARLRIGARRAERFPQISLSGSVGGQGGTLGAGFDFAENWTSSLAANIVAPIFNAGRITANIRSARAAYDQQAAVYARTVLVAYSEASSAIENYQQQRQRYGLIAAQMAEARSSLDLQKRRFSVGVGGYIAYLDASRAVYHAETSLSSAARATALARLGVHRALGGNWASGTESVALEMVEIDQLQATGENE